MLLAQWLSHLNTTKWNAKRQKWNGAEGNTQRQLHCLAALTTLACRQSMQWLPLSASTNSTLVTS